MTRYTEGIRHFVTSKSAPVASGWSGRRVGLAPTGKRRLTTAHTHSGHCWRCTWAGYLHLYACLSVALEPVVTVLGLRTHADVGISNFNGVPRRPCPLELLDTSIRILTWPQTAQSASEAQLSGGFCLERVSSTVILGGPRLG